MKLTTRGRYAVTALAEIARRGDGACVCLADIARAQQLPLAYLEQVFQALRSAGLVCGARGRGGGYRLCQAAEDVSAESCFSCSSANLASMLCS